MNKPKVLVVDDERPVSFLLSRALSAAGCDVTVVDDGMDAYMLARDGSFDIILLDHLIPGLLGTEVLQRLKDENVATPVILVSGVTGEDAVVRGLQLGAVDYIRKPFSVPELVARVQVHLRGWKP